MVEGHGVLNHPLPRIAGQGAVGDGTGDDTLLEILDPILFHASKANARQTLVDGEDDAAVAIV